MTAITKRRKRYVSGTGKVNGYSAGRTMVEPFPPEPPVEEPQPTDDYLRWFVNDWALQTDQRLDSIDADVYDLADRINQLIIMICVGMLLLVVGVGVLLMLALT